MLLYLALQNAECRMQNAECRCSMQNADAECRCRMQIALQNCRSEHILVKSQTACAAEALGRIQSLRAFRRAWGLGSRALGEGAFSEGTWQTWRQHRIEITSKLLKNGANMAAKWALEASWRSLGAALGARGALVEIFKQLGRLQERVPPNFPTLKSGLRVLLERPRAKQT